MNNNIDLQEVFMEFVSQECEKLGNLLLTPPKYKVGDYVKFEAEKKYSKEYQKTYIINKIEVKKERYYYGYFYQCGYSVGDQDKRYKEHELILTEKHG